MPNEVKSLGERYDELFDAHIRLTKDYERARTHLTALEAEVNNLKGRLEAYRSIVKGLIENKEEENN